MRAALAKVLAKWVNVRAALRSDPVEPCNRMYPNVSVRNSAKCVAAPELIRTTGDQAGGGSGSFVIVGLAGTGAVLGFGASRTFFNL